MHREVITQQPLKTAARECGWNKSRTPWAVFFSVLCEYVENREAEEATHDEAVKASGLITFEEWDAVENLYSCVLDDPYSVGWHDA